MENKVNHIAVILDGNRRFSKKLMKEPWKGHEYGARKVREFLEWCEEFDIKEVTLYSFSMQNFSRPKKEFDYLMELFRKEFDRLINEKMDELNEKGVRVNVIGRIELFPKDVYERMLKIMELTKDNTKRKVNFAMAYGGREEIIDAVNKILKEKREITAEEFSKYLYLGSEPDLIIRTGGEIRTSNFLVWQSIYSEWYFIVDKTWPEFTKEDLIKCLEDFSKRERRYGR